MLAYLRPTISGQPRRMPERGPILKAVVVTAPGQVGIGDVPMPQPGPYDALVRIEACSICNSTDAKIIDRHFVSHIPLPLIPGHESVGTVLQVGEKVRSYRPGQRVLRPGAEYGPEVGMFSAWGGMAEYGLVTDLASWRRDHPDETPGGMWAKQQVIPSDIEPGAATALITLKETLFATRAAGVDSTTWTAIVGTGPVARSFTFWAPYLKAPFLVVFGRSDRYCHDFLDLGANNYVAGQKPCGEDEFKNAGLGAFDRVIEAVGSSQALEDALQLRRQDGRVSRYGVPADNDADTSLIIEARQEGVLHDLPVREEDVHQEMLSLVRNKTVDLDDWISHRLPFEEIKRGLEMIRTRQAFKVVLEL